MGSRTRGVHRLAIVVTASLLVLSSLAPLPSITLAKSEAVCFDPSLPVTQEEQRMTDGAPIPQRILKDSRFDQFVEKFERDLCAAQNVKHAQKIVEGHGTQLWKTAVHRAQGKRPDLGKLDRYDDRPLYWARLHMTKALR